VSESARNSLQFRETDSEVRRRIGRWPLSVSTDRIALPAMRAMALLHRHGVTDKSRDENSLKCIPLPACSAGSCDVEAIRDLANNAPAFAERF